MVEWTQEAWGIHKTESYTALERKQATTGACPRNPMLGAVAHTMRSNRMKSRNRKLTPSLQKVVNSYRETQGWGDKCQHGGGGQAMVEGHAESYGGPGMALVWRPDRTPVFDFGWRECTFMFYALFLLCVILHHKYGPMSE